MLVEVEEKGRSVVEWDFERILDHSSILGITQLVGPLTHNELEQSNSIVDLEVAPEDGPVATHSVVVDIDYAEEDFPIVILPYSIRSGHHAVARFVSTADFRRNLVSLILI
jgi:hypothetical protein